MAQAPAPRTDSPAPAAGAEPPTAGPAAGAGEAGRTRRGLLIGAGLAGAAGLAAACGGGDDAGGAAGGEGSGGGGGEGGAGGGNALARTSEIPVGGGKIFEAEKVVVVQPAQGQFKAYSTACTHKGCPVKKVSGGVIECPCHGSKFKIEDGSVASPPATKPLEEKQINVQGDQITLA